MRSIRVRLNLSCSTSSFRWCSTRRTRNSSVSPSVLSSHSSILNTSPSIVSERSLNLSNSAWSTHNRLPSNRTSPSFRHLPTDLRIVSISQQGCWSVNCSLVPSSRDTGEHAPSVSACQPRRLTERARRPESRGEAHPSLQVGFGPSKATTLCGCAHRSTLDSPNRETLMRWYTLHVFVS